MRTQSAKSYLRLFKVFSNGSSERYLGWIQIWNFNHSNQKQKTKYIRSMALTVLGLACLLISKNRWINLSINTSTNFSELCSRKVSTFPNYVPEKSASKSFLLNKIYRDIFLSRSTASPASLCSVLQSASSTTDNPQLIINWNNMESNYTVAMTTSSRLYINFSRNKRRSQKGTTAF